MCLIYVVEDKQTFLVDKSWKMKTLQVLPFKKKIKLQKNCSLIWHCVSCDVTTAHVHIAMLMLKWNCAALVQMSFGSIKGQMLHLITLTWKTSSLPPTLNCDSNRTVNFSSVTDSAPRRSDRLIRFSDCTHTHRNTHQDTSDKHSQWNCFLKELRNCIFSVE